MSVCTGFGGYASTRVQLREWHKLYADVFGIECGISPIGLPEGRGDFERLIVVSKGVTLEMALSAAREMFNCRVSGVAQKTFGDSRFLSRKTYNQGYAVLSRERLNADEEYRGYSVYDMVMRAVNTMTLLERLLFEIKYFTETGSHLDTEYVTACAGVMNFCADLNIDANKSAPVVWWSEVNNRLNIDCTDVMHGTPLLGVREVVTY